jgi:hypothetical protein
VATKPKSVQRLITMSTAALCIASSAIATEQAAPFEGTIEATLTRAGAEATRFAFTRKDDLLRIENTSNKLEPINIVDLAAKKLTIVYPHNTTFVHLDLNKAAAQPSAPPLPPNFPAQPTLNASRSEAATARIGPNISPPPGFPSPPPMPSIPQMPSGRMPDVASKMPALPNQMPPMSNSPGAPGMSMPGMPMMPPTMGPFGPHELKKTEKTKKIEGFECTLYTLSDRGQNFEIWATEDAALFPFQLIQREYLGRRFGPQMIEEQWPELLQKKSLFPLEATLKMEPGGQERLSFKIEKIDKHKIDSAEAEKLFSPPEKYIEIEAPQL